MWCGSVGPRPNVAGVWSPRRTADGSLTLVHEALAQACHSEIGAWTEACERYAQPTRLTERARSGDFGGRVRLLDIGTGLGWNLAAALAALEGSGCALFACGLESERSVLEHAIRLAKQEASSEGQRWWSLVARAFEDALVGPERAADEGVEFQEGRGRLWLRIGDGRRTLEPLRRAAGFEAFDAVFLDAFSPAVDPPLWERGFLARVAARMEPSAWLSTYSASARVRLHLALAGLRVGRGPRVGGKAQGTLASRTGRPEPLSPRDARRLQRRVERNRAPAPWSPEAR